ncbi:hypothetical protein FB474_3328 [Oryzihumus leptocrescens]|uniref:Uncharacterized protein n=1 Tax=Oryzihumus leptocrescens TaxID=297536 RepID=A0A542ZNP1_9MICO|nr:hypothetical protein [Oryzihumus leptocrescens]TQL61906.1 hypothetical protein FB474_3328 [Oryzihumus leptocrescens]
MAAGREDTPARPWGSVLSSPSPKIAAVPRSAPAGAGVPVSAETDAPLVGEPLLQRFLASLRAHSSTVEYDRASGQVTLRTWHDWTLGAPLTFTVMPTALAQACAVDSAARDAYYPNVDILTAGLYLLLAHLERLVCTGRTTGLALTANGWSSEEVQAARLAQVQAELVAQGQPPARLGGRQFVYNPDVDHPVPARRKARRPRRDA